METHKKWLDYGLTFKMEIAGVFMKFGQEIAKRGSGSFSCPGICGRRNLEIACISDSKAAGHE